jgi:hypothetical protein
LHWPAACTAMSKVWHWLVLLLLTAMLQVAARLGMTAPTSMHPMHVVSVAQAPPPSPDMAAPELPLEEPLAKPLPLLLVELPLPLPLPPAEFPLPLPPPEDPDDPLPDPLPDEEPLSSPLPLPDELLLDPKPVPPPPLPLEHPTSTDKLLARIASLRIGTLRAASMSERSRPSNARALTQRVREHTHGTPTARPQSSGRSRPYRPKNVTRSRPSRFDS